MCVAGPLTAERVAFDLSRCTSLDFLRLGEESRAIPMLTHAMESLCHPVRNLNKINIVVHFFRNIFRPDEWTDLRNRIRHEQDFPMLTTVVIDIHVATVRRVTDPDVDKMVDVIKTTFREGGIKFHTDVWRHVGVDLG